MNNNNESSTLDDLGVIPVWTEEYSYLDSPTEWLNHKRFAKSGEVDDKNMDIICQWMRQPFDELRRRQEETLKEKKERSRSVSLGRVSNIRRLQPSIRQAETEDDDDEDEDSNDDDEEETPTKAGPLCNVTPVMAGNASVERTKTFTRKRLNGTITKFVRRTGTFKARSLSTANGSTGSIDTTNGSSPSNGLSYNNNFEYLRDLETSKSQDAITSEDTNLDNRLAYRMMDNDFSPTDLNSTFSKRMSRLNTNTFRKPSSSFGMNRMSDLNRNHAYPTSPDIFSPQKHLGHQISASPTHTEPKILGRKPLIPAKPAGLVRKIPQPRSLSSSRFGQQVLQRRNFRQVFKGSASGRNINTRKSSLEDDDDHH